MQTAQITLTVLMTRHWSRDRIQKVKINSGTAVSALQDIFKKIKVNHFKSFFHYLNRFKVELNNILWPHMVQNTRNRQFFWFLLGKSADSQNSLLRPKTPFIHTMALSTKDSRGLGGLYVVLNSVPTSEIKDLIKKMIKPHARTHTGYAEKIFKWAVPLCNRTVYKNRQI